MDDLVIEQRRALQIARRRKKKSEKDRKPLTLTGAMIDLSKDGIDKPVYEGLVRAKVLPKRRGEIIGPPCGPPGINLNPDNLPVILTEEEKIQFHIRVRDEKIRREREELETNNQLKVAEEEEIKQEQEAIDKMLRFRNSSPRRPKNFEESYDWFCSSDDDKETKADSDPSQVIIKKSQPTPLGGVRNVLNEIRRNRENIQNGAEDNVPEQLLKDDKTTTYAGDVSTKAPDDKENTTSLANNNTTMNNDTDNDRSMVRDLSEDNKSQNYRDENGQSESTLSPERNKIAEIVLVDVKSDKIHSEDEITDRSVDKKSAKSGINEHEKCLAESEVKSNTVETAPKDQPKLKSILKDDTNSVRLSQSTVNSKAQSMKSRDESESQKTNKSKSKKLKKSVGKGKQSTTKKSSPINIVNVKNTQSEAAEPVPTKSGKKAKKSKSKKKSKAKSRNASMASHVSEKSMDVDDQSVASKSRGKSSAKKKDKNNKPNVELPVKNDDKEISTRSKVTEKAESIKSVKSTKSKTSKKSKKTQKKKNEPKSAKSDVGSVCTEKSNQKKSEVKPSTKAQKKIVKDGDRKRAVREGKASTKKEDTQLSQATKVSEKKSSLRERLESASAKSTPKSNKGNSKSQSKVKEQEKTKSSKKSSSKSSPKQKAKETEEVKTKKNEGKSSTKKAKSSKKQSKGKVSTTKSDKENARQKKPSPKQQSTKDRIGELKQKIENKIKVNKSAIKNEDRTSKSKKPKGIKEKRKKKNDINAEDYMI